MTDVFRDTQGGLQSPATHLVQVTPDDGTDLPIASRALNVAESGTVRVTTVGDTTAVVTVCAGGIMPIRVKRIWQTGTTATGIVVLY